MAAPRFSVVIPTRDRESTLAFTLQTCLAQEFDDFEIVVSDNSTTAATQELIERLADPRIRRVRPARPLAMTDNWDFAVEQARGEYVTLIGSDDGLLAHALPELDRIIRMLDAKVLRWDAACYNWPDLPAQKFASANELLIPMKQADHYLPIHRCDSREKIRAAANFQIPYSDLPMIYCTAIHRSVVAAIRERTGRVFRSVCPDVYSAFAFAHAAGTYYSLDAPMSINGLSGGSNGVANLYLKDMTSPVSDDFWRLNTEAQHQPHRWIPKLMAMPAWVADSFQYAKEALFPDDDMLFCDRRLLILSALKELRASDEKEWQNALQMVRDSVADDAELARWFEDELGGKSHEEFEFAPHHKLRRYGQTYLHLDAADFGVTNVMGAAQLCEKILGFKLDGVNAHLKPTAQTT